MDMKPRPRPYDPFASLSPPVQPQQRQAANDAVTRSQSARPSTNGRSVLEERYPGMVQAITLMWGHPEMNAYFDRLWLADGTQTPIDPEAMSELMVLAQVHHNLIPQRPQRSLANIYGTAYTPAKRDVWEDVPRRR
ncbi:MAG TPA: hypothetical protein VFR86_13560 [Burkholderiaceae bacterium]|nr:hypothetical protein [Burkholderiaceae bacterium]